MWLFSCPTRRSRPSLGQFVSGLRADKTPELIQYLKERRLYVNDPVQVSEEV